jgi:hypothetical protein
MISAEGLAIALVSAAATLAVVSAAAVALVVLTLSQATKEGTKRWL